MVARIGHETEEKCQIVDACYLHCKQFLRLEKVVQVCLGVDAVDVASVRVDGGEVVLPLLVAHVHRTVVGEEHGVAPVACRHDTVEHVDATFYRLEYVLWCAYAH